MILFSPWSSLLVWKKGSPGLSPPTAESLIRGCKTPPSYTICRKTSSFFPHVFHDGEKIWDNWINLFFLLSLSPFQVNLCTTTRWILIKCPALVQILPKLPIILRINSLMWLIKPSQSASMYILGDITHFCLILCSNQLNCFQFPQQVIQTLNFRFLHMILPLSETPLPTLNTYTLPGNSNLFIREGIISVLLPIGI